MADIKNTSFGTIIKEQTTTDSGDIIVNKYKKGKFLGKGGFAKCYEVTDMETDAIYAAKIISKASLVKPRAKQKLKSEIKIHKSMNHRGIVKFVKHFEDKECIYILLELCKNNLNEIVKRRKRFKEIEVRCYVAQLVDTMKYLKKMNIIHRDLKLGNLLLTEDMELKVCDFGLAAEVIFEGEKRRTICGTPNYIAPEVLSSKIGHSYEVDLWSLGVITYTMLFGRPPFETRDVKVTYRKIRHNNYTFPTHVTVSESSKDFIRSLLRTDPLKRLTLDKIMDHDFFSEDYPSRLPVAVLNAPPTAAFMQKYIRNPDEPPKPGVSPGKAPTAKDIATFE